LRKASVDRKTSETNIKVDLCLDGSGQSKVTTGIPFLDHMLDQMARHGLLNLAVQAKGDLDVGFHHTVEDVGICVGKAIRKALGEAREIRRFGHAQIPMDDALVSVTMDISGRPYLVCNLPNLTNRVGIFPVALIREFFRALSVHAGMTLHVRYLDGENAHHVVEAVFKAFGRALTEATAQDERIEGIPSTKGILAES
jgi:imidazoleglycerol-phosphate dehydratase